jgi:4-diphosphocytidyl-2-C-methyl-D-erythritol kinase
MHFSILDLEVMMLSVFSPAKVNLFLRVLGKRPDGYHELSTLLQTIDLGDTLYFQLEKDDSLTCTDLVIPLDTSNLILKAAHLFRNKTGFNGGLKTHLVKRIPIQAGLGGGSSNAATTLWAFNQLAGQIATIEELRNWSAELGSDVPFFFSTGTAHCTGRGECIFNLPVLSGSSLCIVKPCKGLSTPEVYRRFQQDLSKKDPQNDLELFLAGRLNPFNDLEQAAFEVSPELKDLKIFLLKRGFETVLMTGSGSAFFCLGKGEVPSYPDLSVFYVRFLNRESSNWYEHNHAQ